ncbi:MAG: hypothetical protein A2Z35_03690 [Actinobacteria bacterium RBG_19FT_COMBO_36_27]|nr:MAG: hypothetical protein A2Z35_03690 [Actinobacteria bacterium RBG_19FT_COMBO_36_27]
MIKIIDSNGSIRECVKIAVDTSYPGFIRADFISKIRKGYKHSEWFPQDEFLKSNPGVITMLDKTPLVIKEDLGVVTKSGDNYLQDISKNWKKDIYVGIPVWISRGKGESQQRVIIKNDKNKLYIDKKWGIKPDKTSQYVLSFNVQENIKPQGNVLPGVEAKELISKMIKKAKKSI